MEIFTELMHYCSYYNGTVNAWMTYSPHHFYCLLFSFEQVSNVQTTNFISLNLNQQGLVESQTERVECDSINFVIQIKGCCIPSNTPILVPLSICRQNEMTTIVEKQPKKHDGNTAFLFHVLMWWLLQSDVLAYNFYSLEAATSVCRSNGFWLFPTFIFISLVAFYFHPCITFFTISKHKNKQFFFAFFLYFFSNNLQNNNESHSRKYILIHVHIFSGG